LILEYPHLSHDDKKMKMIRPTIRSSEMVPTAIEPYNENFLNLFWEEVLSDKLPSAATTN